MAADQEFRGPDATQTTLFGLDRFGDAGYQVSEAGEL
jgi:hypothetical protein